MNCMLMILIVRRRQWRARTRRPSLFNRSRRSYLVCFNYLQQLIHVRHIVAIFCLYLIDTFCYRKCNFRNPLLTATIKSQNVFRPISTKPLRTFPILCFQCIHPFHMLQIQSIVRQQSIAQLSKPNNSIQHALLFRHIAAYLHQPLLAFLHHTLSSTLIAYTLLHFHLQLCCYSIARYNHNILRVRNPHVPQMLMLFQSLRMLDFHLVARLHKRMLNQFVPIHTLNTVFTHHSQCTQCQLRVLQQPKMLRQIQMQHSKCWRHNLHSNHEVISWRNPCSRSMRTNIKQSAQLLL
mmetsp:Transcript_457/g.827  ORF Transcript_457/g.827 Transcript_457/m.827 type:complete len:293 (+) Transcript_457:379-1257(+)